MKNNLAFDRVGRMLGNSFVAQASRCRVIIFGIGGVGSWCAEGLIRSGIGHLTLVDSDNVCVTNINRQRMATIETIGQPKVEALRTELLKINPDAEIEIKREFYTEQLANSFDFNQYDYVIDAIDSLESKALLLLRASQSKAKLFSSMGAAKKMNPLQIDAAEFWKVKGCPLARALRSHFKKNNLMPQQKFLCVYSEERIENLRKDVHEENTGEASQIVTHGNGSMVHITAIFGFTLVGLLLQDLQSNSI